MNYRELTGKTIEEAFQELQQNSPGLFVAFEKEALRAINHGRTRLSAKLIINTIRWNRYVEHGDESFKINDAFQSRFARWFEKKYPMYAGMFNMRKLRSEEAGPYMLVDENGQLSFV